MNTEDLPALIVLAIVSYIVLTIVEAPKERKLCDYVQRIAMAQWMEWMREFQRTGRWNH